MKWLFFYRRDLVVCYVYLIFLHFFIYFLNMIFTLTLKESCAEPVLGSVNSFPIELYSKITRKDCF